MVTVCPSSPGPGLMPESVSVCIPESSGMAAGAGITARAGESLTAVTITVKNRVMVSSAAGPSLTLTLSMADPEAFGAGAKRSEPEVPPV